MGEKKIYTAKITDFPRQEYEVDKETGEIIKMTETIVSRSLEVPVLEDYVDIKLPRKFRFNNGGFITVFQKAMANIALFGNLSKEEYRMLLYLIGTCGPANSICIDLVQLSEQLSMKKSNVSRALKGLVERNIVIRKDGYRYGKTPLPFELHLNFDQINYDLAYNGKIKEFGKHKTEHPHLMKSDGETPLLSKIKEDSKETGNEENLPQLPFDE
jgi:hypothetical protein